jgi:GTP-binding protein HflX
MERAILITVKFKSEKDSWRMQDLALELEALAATCGAAIVESISYHGERPTPNFFIGRGKAEEIAFQCAEEQIDTVIFSRDLSGTQQRNLEEIIDKKTLDRTQLILDIFARHAKSPEGKMQVELAQLQYLLPRLVGKGVILSRLGGGIGTSGPGEQKLEVDRRRIRKRIEKLQDDLKRLAVHRNLLRKNRKERGVPCVALVGYTNAGKSTLLNAFTQANQVISNTLFTTLDPLSKALVLPNGEHIVLSDTVGFLNNLPHHLIEAFKATLEEVVEADLLIHVLDVHHPRVYEHNQAVISVLDQLGVADKPRIAALNKIDLLDDQTWLQKLMQDFAPAVAISAKLSHNLNLLLEEAQKYFVRTLSALSIQIPHTRMDLVDLFYREGKVKEIEYLNEGIRVKVDLPNILAQKLLRDKEVKAL